MVEISPETGLPELPEGFIWKLERAEVHDYGYTNRQYLSNHGWWIRVGKMQTVTISAPKGNSRGWWIFQLPAVKIENETVEKFVAEDYGSAFIPRFGKDAEEAEATTWDEKSYVPIPLTPERVAEAAEVVFRQWKEIYLSNEFERTALGTYPPKSLT